MKKMLKKAISILLVMSLVMSFVQTGYAVNEDSNEPGKVLLEISSNSAFSWGDSIEFTVTIVNQTGSRITGVDLVSEAKGMSKYFSETAESAESINFITPGASRTVKVIYNSKATSTIGAIFLLPVSFFAGLFSRFSRDYEYQTKIKVGFSNVVFGFDADFETSSNANSGDINLDDPDPDVEIYSFNTSDFDGLVGNSEDVIFTSEIFANIELDANDVVVEDENGEHIGVMNDEGVDGDAYANDGIYSLKAELYSDTVRTTKYCACVNGVKSNDITIGYYKEYTSTELDQLSTVISMIDTAASKYLDEAGFIAEGKLTEAMNDLSSVAETLVDSGIVETYSVENNTINLELVNGASYSYSFSESGTDSTIGIVTAQPFKHDGDEAYNDYNQGLSDEATDDAARRIEDNFEAYYFNSRTENNELNTQADGNYDRGEVSLENMKTIINSPIFAWHGHGGYDRDTGSYMGTGEKYSASVYSRYQDDINANRIVLSNGRFWITGGFVQKYANDLSGHFLYLGTCSSAKDMEDGNTNSDWELATEFNKKGAVVIGNTDVIYTRYNTRMEASVYSRMCDKKENGEYYSLSEALEYAKEVHGENDGHTENAAYVKIYPETQAAGNFKLYDVTSGTISGVIKNASNSATLSNVLVRAYKNDELVASTRTKANGSYSLVVPAGDYIVKVSVGGFKTAKMAVTVRQGATTYNETFLLITAGLNSGFANGITLNAITGEVLSDVRINIRNSWNNHEGEIIETLTSNVNGYYEISLPAGLYTFECYKDGYITTYKNILVFIYDYTSQNITLAPELTEDYYRVVLTWGTDPSDLDSHLFGNSDNSSYHVYYSNKNGYDNNNNVVANLDVDDTTSYGPETTTFYVSPDGNYDFYVDWYSGYGTWAASGGKVEVYNAAYLVNTYYVPNVSNRSGSWHVFSINNGIYTDYNTITEDVY